MVDIRISSKEGFNVGSENNNFVILNTTLTEDLILEGLARECVSKVQQLRKSSDFNIVDRINLYYSGDEDFDKAIEKFDKYIKDETLSLSITKDDNLTESFDLNGHDVKLKVEKVG
jgi:isoleucyl-tRNA synthetase